MNAWIIAGILLAIVVIFIFLLMPLFFFRSVFRRKGCIDFSDERAVEKTVWKPYFPVFRDGIVWFRQQQPEQVCVTSRDGLHLKGWYLPSEQARGTILLMHGYHSSGWNDFGCVVRFYHELGYHLLLADQRAHGESEGKYIGFGVLERFDCLCWVTYLNERLGHKEPVFLDGLSMGASTVLMASGLPLPENVRGIIADCGFTSPDAIFRHVLRTRYRLPVYPVLPIVNQLCRWKAGFGFRDCSTVDALKQNRLPVLLIHGKADRFVPPRMSCENYEACRGAKKLLLVEGAHHAASFLISPKECEQALRDFLNRYG